MLVLAHGVVQVLRMQLYVMDIVTGGHTYMIQHIQIEMGGTLQERFMGTLAQIVMTMRGAQIYLRFGNRALLVLKAW